MSHHFDDALLIMKNELKAKIKNISDLISENKQTIQTLQDMNDRLRSEKELNQSMLDGLNQL